MTDEQAPAIDYEALAKQAREEAAAAKSVATPTAATAAPAQPAIDYEALAKQAVTPPRPKGSTNPADYANAPPGIGRMAPPRQHSDLYHDVVDPFKEAWEAVREGQIGRAFGISTETAEARKEESPYYTPVLRFNSRPTGPLAGVQRGLENFATGLTTPTNLLLAVGSGGLGALEGQLGRSLLSRLASAGFSGQMLHGAYQQIPALRDAWNKSDWQEVQRVLTEQVLGTKFAYKAGKHAVKGSPAPATQPKPKTSVTGEELRDAYRRNPELREAVKAQDPIATKKILEQEGLGAAAQGPRPAREMQGPPPVPRKIVSTLVDALKPPGGDVEFSKKLDSSLPEISQTAAETGKPIKGLHQLLDNVKLSKARVWKQFEDITQPLADTIVDLTPIAQGIRNSITKTMRIENPEMVDRLNAMADRYKGAQLTLAEVEQMWHEGNAELDSYYAKNPAAQRSAAAKNPDTAATDARVRELREAMYNHLDLHGGTAGKVAMERFGALRDLEGHATRHYNDALRTVPGPIQALFTPETVVPGLLTGELAASGPAGATAWALTAGGKAWLAKQRSIDSQITKAFSGYKGTPAAMPQPVQQLPLTYKGGVDVAATPSGQAGLPFGEQVAPRTQGPEQWRLGTTGGIDVPASSSMHPSGQGSFLLQEPPAPAPHQPPSGGPPLPDAASLIRDLESRGYPTDQAQRYAQSLRDILTRSLSKLPQYETPPAAPPAPPELKPMSRPPITLRLPFTKEGVNIPASEAAQPTGQGTLPFEPQPTPLNRLKLPAPAPPTREEFQMPPSYTKDFTWKPPESFPDIEHKNYIQRWNPKTGRYDIIPKEEHRRGGLLRYPTRQQVLRSLHGQSGG